VVKEKRKIILASASPRRREILNQVGISFTVCVSGAAEELFSGSPAEIVQALAAKKAEEVWRENPEALVIGADTVVVCDGKILGKPKERQDAAAMLKSLCGHTHEVFTGVAIRCQEEQFEFFERTEVVIGKLSEEEMEAYLDTPEPYDKAGAYGIQGSFAKYITEIHGDFYNVMGLPISHLYRELKKRNWLS